MSDQQSFVLAVATFLFVALLAYVYGKVQGWREKREREPHWVRLDPNSEEAQAILRDFDAMRRDAEAMLRDFPRPMSCQPSKGWIKESRRFEPGTDQEIIERLTSKKTFDA